MTKKIHSVAIIGCGSIGAMKPNKYDWPGGPNILTHAHAVTDHPRFRIHSLIDTIPDKAEAAGKKWNAPWGTNIAGFFDDPPDVVVIATPTNTHSFVVDQVAQSINQTLRSPLFVLEKPVGNSLEECEFIRDRITGGLLSRPVVVNYTRRFEPHHRNIAAMIKDGGLGRIYNCTIRYCRGLIRDGSHAIDLCNWWFGKRLSFGQSQRILHGRINDYPDDLSYAMMLRYERCDHVVLLPVDGRKYDLFEIDLCCEAGRYRLMDHGERIIRYEPGPEPHWGDYSILYEESIRTTLLKKTLMYLYNNISGILNREPENPANRAIPEEIIFDLLEDSSCIPLCSIYDAVAVWETIDSNESQDLTINERRAIKGYDAIEGGDIIFTESLRKI